MSLTASMWTSVSGLLAHGEKMNVVGNNIANVNTVGFKSSRMDFQDFVHQTVNSASGPAQVGRGTSIGAIYGDFSQGAFETSSETTDMAINGNGFFKVVPKNGDDAYYTRAGNFRFDAQGYLVDPHGYVLQGWEIERPSLNQATSTALAATNTGSAIVGTGVPKDVRLDSFSCDPKHTTNMTVAVNLDSNCGAEKSSDATDPFASMLKDWTVTTNPAGNINPPLGTDGFTYQSSMTVYDEGGTPHVLTIYFDPVDNANDPDMNHWEYLVTMDPSEDLREFKNGGTVASDKRGLLMAGTLSFNKSGNLQEMSAYVPTTANLGNLDTWVPAPISSNGYPMFAANFSGQTDASDVWDPANMPTTGAPGELNPETMGYYTELNLGLRTTSNWWDGLPGNISLSNVDDRVNRLAGFGPSAQKQDPASTAYGSSNGNNFFERYANQDGYTYGELSSIYVDQGGILSGRYSNGVTLELFQITLYDFSSLTNLRREGGNLFTQTRESGDPTQGAANSGGFGSVHANSLEQSNVDLAREFVQMITTQRGFQANSKSVTTVDTMLETVIGMKR